MATKYYGLEIQEDGGTWYCLTADVDVAQAVGRDHNLFDDKDTFVKGVYGSVAAVGGLRAATKSRLISFTVEDEGPIVFDE